MHGQKNALFLRGTFNVPDAAAWSFPRLRLQADDGVIVFLNGVEIYRQNMPSGPPVWNSLATAGIQPTTVLQGVDINLATASGSLLVSGTNTLAVQVANSFITDSELLFRANVAAVPAGAPPDDFRYFDFTLDGPPLRITAPTVPVPPGARFMRLAFKRAPNKSHDRVILDNLRIDGTPREADPLYLEVPAEFEVIEPPGGATTALVPVTLSRADPEDIAIEYTTRANRDEATADVDFVSVTSTLVVPAGETVGHLSVTILSDAEVEGPEEFDILLPSVSKGYPTNGYTIVRILPATPTPPAPPEIASFTAVPSPEGFDLSWATSGADAAFIARIGAVPTNGNLAVAPVLAKTYELVARNADGDARAFVTVEPESRPLVPSPITPGFSHGLQLWRERVAEKGAENLYRFAVPTCEHLDIAVDPGPHLRARLQVLDSNGATLADDTAPAKGAALRTRVIPGDGDTVLTIKISGFDLSGGDFALGLQTDTEPEQEGIGAGINDTTQTAEPLGARFRALNGNASTLLLAGRLADADTDHFAIGLLPGETLGASLRELDGTGKVLSLLNVQGTLIAEDNLLKASGERALAFRNGGAASRYYLKVTGSPGTYHLKVIRGGLIGRGRNDTSTTVHGFSGSHHTALGSTGLPRPETPVTSITAALSGDFDTALDAPARQVAAMVVGWNVDFFLSLGDQNYDYRPISFLESIGTGYGSLVLGRSDAPPGIFSSPIQRYFPALGNHDGGGSNLVYGFAFPEFIDEMVDDPLRLRLPKGSGAITNDDLFYDCTWGPAHVFVVSSDRALSENTPGSREIQRRWLRTALAQSRSPWNIVAFHHPPYSSGGNGASPEMRWDFKGWGADVVLSGHNHSFQHYQVEGLDYFISGLGGHGIYDVGTESFQLFRYNATYGATRLTATDTSMEIAFHSIDDGASGTQGGRVVYSHTLEKGLSSGDVYPIHVQAGDTLAISTITRLGGLPPSGSDHGLDPAVALFAPSGTLVASDNSGAPDGRNALVSHLAQESGPYQLRVQAENHTYGTYAVEVAGATGDPGEAFRVISLSSSGTNITVTFSDPVRLDTITPLDLTHGGLPATSITPVTQKSVRFRGLQNLDSAGAITSMAAGSCLSLMGRPLVAFQGVPYAAWASTFFTPGSPASVTGANADPNGDGIENLIHFAIGTDPTAAGVPEVLRLEANADGQTVLRFRTWSLATVSVTVEASASLAVGSWQAWDGPLLRHSDGDFIDWEAPIHADPTEAPPASAFRLRVR